MTTRSTNPGEFFESPLAVALRARPSQLFGLLTKSVRLPPDRVGLVKRERGNRVLCRPGGEINERDVIDVLLVRLAPIRLRYESLTASSVDHHLCSVAVTLTVAPIAEASELASFDRAVVGTAGYADHDAVKAYFLPHVAKAAAAAAEGRGVEVLLGTRSSDDVAAEMIEQLKGPAFTAGLQLEGPIDARFDSTAYRQAQRARAEIQRRREEFAAQRRIAQAVQQAQNARAEHLTALLAQLREQADRNPKIELADLIRSFPETERGEIYNALFATCDGQMDTRSIVVGSGAELLVYEPTLLDRPVERITLPDRVGPVRSVHAHMDAAGERRLFVGAGTGVYELSIEDGKDVHTYAVEPPMNVRGGVNAVALVGDRIVASHSELGLLSWRRGSDEPAEFLLRDQTRDADAIRGVQFVNGDLFFSIDARVVQIQADDPNAEPREFVGSGSVITALCAADGVYAGNAEGEVLYWALDAPDQPQRLNSARRRPAESVVVLDFGTLQRLFYTDTSLAVLARVLGDTFTCRYEAGGQTLRRTEVASDLIVATNELRDRLICWRPGQPAKPYGVAQVARLTGRSIQDVCLLSAV